MNIPYNATVNLKTTPEETYTTPEQAAQIAHELSPQQVMTQRVEYLRVVSEKNQHSIGCQKLLQVIQRRNDAHQTLSMIGYENLRHLQAAGMTIAEIAMDVGINQLDIMAFMTTHPEAVAHAEIDTMACADMKMAEFIREVDEAIPETKFESDRLRVKMTTLEMLTKRLSPKWAQQMQNAQQADTTIGVTFAMDLSGAISPKVADPKVIEAN